MWIKFAAAAHNLEQVLALVDTPVDYIRLGYPYCYPLAEFLWPPEKIELALGVVAEAGKVPQFQWLISPTSSAQAYVEDCLEIIKKFPRSEIVIGHWGGVGLLLDSIKLAACGLAIYNSSLVCLLREQGISIIGLPLRLNTNQMLAAIINSSPADITFEYHLWGPVVGSHWWRCPSGDGGCNPQACVQSSKFTHQRVEFSLRGHSLWLTPGVDNLSRALELAELGIERGLIQLPDLPAQAVAEVIDYCLARIAGEQTPSVAEEGNIHHREHKRKRKKHR